MAEKQFDVIVIGCGSGGLSVGLFMNQAGFRVLMVSKTDHEIGGDCLNDGCVPSKAIIHAAKQVHAAKAAVAFGLSVSGAADIKKVTDYVHGRQEIIRAHENADWLRAQGITVALGPATFTGRNKIAVEGTEYSAKKIVIATGSRPVKLKVPGIEQVRYFDNENIFGIAELPRRLLVIGGGPIGIELGQTMQRLGSAVTVVLMGDAILEHDDRTLTDVLQRRLQQEGMEFIFKAQVTQFSSATEAVVKKSSGEEETIMFDAVFVAIGRALNTENLQLEKAGIDLKDGKLVTDDYLRTTNKNVFVCGDVAGSLQFSHAAEFHARILLNNFFSPLNKKLNNDHMSWVTFTDPELATFGLSEAQLQKRGMAYERLEQDFEDDDRAVTDDYRWAKTVLFISKSGFLKKQKILGGTMVAPGAGELVQELILANTKGLSINAIFNKIYPYPVAARINQKTIVQLKQKALTGSVKKALQMAFKIFS